MIIEFAHRLFDRIDPEIEWLYLINETYVGEMCILPLLSQMLANDVAEPSFGRMLERQLEEEHEHVERYRELLRDRPLEGSGYDRPFTAYVNALPNVTLKIFALQALLEGISLGALRYRLQALARSPHRAMDERIADDERRHTQFAIGFVKHLIATDGCLPRALFESAAHDVNAIFSRHFCGKALAAQLRSEFGVRDLDPQSIDAGVGMRKFRRISAEEVVRSKNQFLERYHATSAPV